MTVDGRGAEPLDHAESTQDSQVAREDKGSRLRKRILPDLRKQAFDATGNAQAMA